MAVAIGGRELNIVQTGTRTNIPSDPKAKLMYYVSCVCSVLEMNDHEGIRRLRDYDRYYCLTESETDELLILCYLLSPDKLIGKCFFPDDELCGDSNNEFYELSEVQSRLLVTQNVTIGHQTRRVNKIMCFKMAWMRNNYF